MTSGRPVPALAHTNAITGPGLSHSLRLVHKFFFLTRPTLANLYRALYSSNWSAVLQPQGASGPAIIGQVFPSLILNWQVVDAAFVSCTDGLRHPVVYPVPLPSTALPSRALDLIRKIMRVLTPAARCCTLSELAIESFNSSDDEAGPLLAVGFNANAWMHSVITVFSWRQAGTGQSHEMETIFCCLAGISRMLLHPYFIFDGLDCPQLRRGIDPVTSSAPRLFVQRFQELLTAFGFDWHVAPREAEAELAYLQSCGAIDAMVTPYNDMLLFGAHCVICSGIPQSGEHEDMEVYTSDAIENRASLEWGDLLLIMLMSSADNEVAAGAAWTLPTNWSIMALEGASFELPSRFNPQHFLGRQYHELAHVIKEECVEFPDPAILAMYLLPLTSWSGGGRPPVTTVTSRQPDLASLAAFCSQRLCWSPETVQSRLMDAWAGTAI
ncbi:PIN domain-like protein [Pisolithus marmoratus]|nr:PIN domain-like protein [Pisolithus marmoratus]